MSHQQGGILLGELPLHHGQELGVGALDKLLALGLGVVHLGRMEAEGSRSRRQHRRYDRYGVHVMVHASDASIRVQQDGGCCCVQPGPFQHSRAWSS